MGVSHIQRNENNVYKARAYNNEFVAIKVVFMQRQMSKLPRQTKTMIKANV